MIWTKKIPRWTTLLNEILELDNSLHIQRKAYKTATQWERYDIQKTGQQTRERYNRLVGVYKKNIKEEFDDFGRKVVDALC